MESCVLSLWCTKWWKRVLKCAARRGRFPASHQTHSFREHTHTHKSVSAKRHTDSSSQLHLTLSPSLYEPARGQIWGEREQRKRRREWCSADNEKPFVEAVMDNEWWPSSLKGSGLVSVCLLTTKPCVRPCGGEWSNFWNSCTACIHLFLLAC